MANLQQTGGGGGGTSLTGTGIARNTGACTELSGDVTTSGSNAASVVKVNGAAVPASATVLGSNSSSQLVDNTASALAVVNTSGRGGFLAGLGSIQLVNSASATVLTANNQVRFLVFVLPFKCTISKMTACGGAGTALVGDVGIYSIDGTTKLASTGAVSYAVNTVATTAVSQGSVTLNPGPYIFAYTGTLATSTLFAFAENVVNFIGNSTAQVGTAANAGSAGVLPSSLGALTRSIAISTIPVVFCEP